MVRSERTSLVVAATSVGLVTLFLIWALGNRFGDGGAPGPDRPRRKAPSDVTLWVGEVHPGLKGALTAVYGDPKPDHAHDQRLNDQLGLSGDDTLAFYRLLLFNTSTEAHHFPLREGGLAVRGKTGPVASLRNLAASGDLRLSGGTRFALESLGTLRDAVDVPPGAMASLVVAFDRHSDLAEAEGVKTAEGNALERRQMSRAQLRRLMADPRAEWIKDL